MSGLQRLIQREPTVIVSIVRYLILIGVAYGLSTNNEQMALILGFVELVLMAINRSQVMPTSTVDATVKAEVREQVAEHDDTRPLTAEERATLSVLREQRDRLEAEQHRRRGG